MLRTQWNCIVRNRKIKCSEPRAVAIPGFTNFVPFSASLLTLCLLRAISVVTHTLVTIVTSLSAFFSVRSHPVSRVWDPYNWLSVTRIDFYSYFDTACVAKYLENNTNESAQYRPGENLNLSRLFLCGQPQRCLYSWNIRMIEKKKPEKILYSAQNSQKGKRRISRTKSQTRKRSASGRKNRWTWTKTCGWPIKFEQGFANRKLRSGWKESSSLPIHCGKTDFSRTLLPFFAIFILGFGKEMDFLPYSHGIKAVNVWIHYAARYSKNEQYLLDDLVDLLNGFSVEIIPNMDHLVRRPTTNKYQHNER